jgi:purine-binding chemotaxis protein CheW
VEKERYGLPLSSVREVVVPPERFTRVPRAPTAISGVMNLRGRVVTVVEMRQLLGLPEGQTPPARLLLLDRGKRDLGFLVTDVDGIEALERVSAVAPGKAILAVRGVARLKGLGITVLDPEGLDAAVVALFTPAK